MILTGPEIVRIVRRTREFRASEHPVPLPSIVIEPFDAELGELS